MAALSNLRRIFQRSSIHLDMDASKGQSNGAEDAQVKSEATALTPLREWLAFGATVTGEQHKRRGLPNQDAITWTPMVANHTAIVAVADGHGSPRNFRSATGAQIAVDSAIAVLTPASAGPEVQIGEIKNAAISDLPRELVHRWRDEVDAHLISHPFQDEELSRAEAHLSPRARESIDSNPIMAYGSTILAALVTRQYAVYLRIGDGDIVRVSRSGEASLVFVKEGSAIGDDTVSLCSKDAWRWCEVAVQPLGDEPPGLILLASDGYSKSFANTDGFLKAGSDFLGLARDQGTAIIQSHLSDWLTQTSSAGSGDDVTVGVIVASPS